MTTMTTIATTMISGQFIDPSCGSTRGSEVYGTGEGVGAAGLRRRAATALSTGAPVQTKPAEGMDR